MKCPLLEIAWQIARPGEKVFESDCLKGECAWWDQDRNICAVKSIFHNLTNIRIELRQMKDNFRK